MPVLLVSVFSILTLLVGAPLLWSSLLSPSKVQAQELPQNSGAVETFTKIFTVNIPATFKELVTVAALTVEGETIFGDSVTFSGGSVFDGQITLQGDIVGSGVNIDVGSGEITASNILYSLSEGDGIEISSGQTPTITNSDRGSAQNIFKKVKLGDSNIEADSNTDTLEFAAGSGISLSIDTSNDKLTITNSSIPGFTTSGTYAVLSSGITRAGIGTSTPSNTLEVNSGTADTSGITFTQLTSSSTAGVGGGKVLSVDSGGKIILVSDQTGSTPTAESVLPTATNGMTLYFNGTAWVASDNLFHDGGSIGISNAAPTSRFHVNTNLASKIGVIVQGYTSQTANLQEWRNSSGSILSYIDSNGVFNGSVNTSGSLNPGFTTGSIAFQGASGLSQDNSNFFWDDTNNRLGIGTNTPGTKIDIISTWSGTATLANHGLRLKMDASPSQAYVGLVPGSGSPNAGYVLFGDGSGWKLHLGATTASPTMTIVDSGNIGIGDTTPTEGKLTLNHASGVGLHLTNSSTGIGIHLANTATDGDPRLAFDINGGGVWNVGANDGDSDKFMITSDGSGTLDNSVHLTIDTSGLVGIGTTNPSSKLDITTTALGVTQTSSSGLALVNTTAAVLDAQQMSPAVRWTGQGWRSNATAISQPVEFQAYVLPVQGASNPTGQWLLRSSVNSAAYASKLIVNSNAGETYYETNGVRINGFGGNTGGISLTGSATIQNTMHVNPGFSLTNSSTPSVSGANVLTLTSAGSSATSGTTNLLSVNASFAPTSGTGLYTNLLLNPTINQTGGANGITRGLFISPTLTAAADWRALEIANNSGYGIYQSGANASNYFAARTSIGTATTPLARLDVRGTSNENVLNLKGGIDGTTVTPQTLISFADFSGNSPLNISDFGSGSILFQSQNRMYFRAQDATDIPVIIRGSATGVQTGELQLWQKDGGGSSGTTVAYMSADGNLGLGASPTSKLHVEGLYGANALTRFNQTGSGDILTASVSGVPKFVINNSGNVGIGTANGNVSYKLQVNGSSYLNGQTIIEGANVGLNLGGSGQYMYLDQDASGNLQFRSHGDVLQSQINQNGGAIFNEQGNDADFRVEGITNAYALFVDASVDRVGIGTSVPSSALDVRSAGSTSGIKLQNTSASGYTHIQVVNNGTNIEFGSDSGLGYVKTSTNNPLFLSVNNTERLRVDITGNIGIGTTAPTSKLHVEGFYGDNSLARFNQTGSGDILTASASGTTRLRLTNAGILEASSEVWANSGANRLTSTGLSRIGGANHYVAVSGGDLEVGSTGNLNFETNGGTTRVMTLDTSGNVGLGTTTFGTSAAKVLAIAGSTAPSTAITNGIQLFAVDQAGSHELRVMDEAGNTTTLSPHNFSVIGDQSEEMAWSFYSERNSLAINADMTKALRLVEKLSGEKLVYLKDLESGLLLEDGSDATHLTELADNGTIGGIAKWNYELWTYVGEVIFEKPVTFLANISIKGKVIHDNQDTAGIAVIKAGVTKVKVTFESPYEQPPIITITPEGTWTEAYITDRSPTGFTIQLKAALQSESQFSWQAVAVKAAKTTVSEDSEPIPSSSPSPLPVAVPTPSPSPEPTPSTNLEPQPPVGTASAETQI